MTLEGALLVKKHLEERESSKVKDWGNDSRRVRGELVSLGSTKPTPTHFCGLVPVSGGEEENRRRQERKNPPIKRTK